MAKAKVDEKTIYIIRSVYFALSLIPRSRRIIYDMARSMLIHDFEKGNFYNVSTEIRAEIKKHLFSFYIPLIPTFGNCGIDPGLPRDTNP